MRVAVTYDNGNIQQHFGSTELFKIFNIEDGRIVSSDIISTNGKGHRELIPVVEALDVDAVICGGLGMPIKEAIENSGKKLYVGVTGDADKAVSQMLDGSIEVNEGAVHTCSHGH